MELEFAKELDRILGALQGPVPEQYYKGNDKFGNDSVSEIIKKGDRNDANQYHIVIRDWDVDHLCEMLSLSRITLCGYLEVLANNHLVHLHEGGPNEIYVYAEIKVAGIHFYRNGGYTKIATDEIVRVTREREAIDKQLEAASKSATAADKTATYTKYLLGITAINVLAFIFTTFNPSSDNQTTTPTSMESEPSETIGAVNNIQQIDSLETKADHTIKKDSSKHQILNPKKDEEEGGPKK